MAATKYTYSISGDFPNQKVNEALLIKEIDESAIATALDYINTEGNDCDIWFVDALSGGDQTTLDGLVAAHQGTDTIARQIRRKSGTASSTSGAWTTKHDFTTAALKEGWWEIDMSYELKLDTGGGGNAARVRVSLYKSGVELNQSPTALGASDSSKYDTRFQGISVQIGEADTLRAHCEFRLDGAGDTAYIRKYRVRFTPLESADES
jgi:hypothetical protein